MPISSLALCHQSIPFPIIHTDASHGTDKHSAKSFSGLITCLANGPIAWPSHLQPVVALSSTEAELIALTNAVHQVNIIYLPTTDNLADFLTKAVPAIKLRGDKIKLNMIIRS